MNRKIANPTPSSQVAASVPPATPVEQLLAKIWSEVLGIDEIGLHDNFFELGGSSLLAMQVVSRLRRALKLDVPLRTLFDKPTLAGLALTVAESFAKEAGSAETSRALDELEKSSEGDPSTPSTNPKP